MNAELEPLAQLSRGTLLIVDDEENIVSALRRLMRREGYQILSANSGADALQILDREWVDVVISDQRMPGMSGVEFLQQAKVMAPDTVRIMLSGYTELGSVTDAINEGAIYKFLTKPWDDAVLTESVREAFQRKALIDDNHRLHERLKRAKDELARHNAGLTEALRTQRRSLERGEQVLRLATEGLDQIPVPVIGIDRDGRVAFVNRVAWEIGSPEAWRLGEPVSTGVPAMIAECVRIAPVQFTIPSLFGQEWILDARVVGEGAERRGIMVTLLPLKPTDWVGPKCC